MELLNDFLKKTSTPVGFFTTSYEDIINCFSKHYLDSDMFSWDESVEEIKPILDGLDKEELV